MILCIFILSRIHFCLNRVIELALSCVSHLFKRFYPAASPTLLLLQGTRHPSYHCSVTRHPAYRCSVTRHPSYRCSVTRHPAYCCSESPVTHLTAAQSPVTHFTAAQSPVTHLTAAQSPVTHLTAAQSNPSPILPLFKTISIYNSTNSWPSNKTKINQ